MQKFYVKSFVCTLLAASFTYKLVQVFFSCCKCVSYSLKFNVPVSRITTGTSIRWIFCYPLQIYSNFFLQAVNMWMCLLKTLWYWIRKTPVFIVKNCYNGKFYKNILFKKGNIWYTTEHTCFWDNSPYIYIPDP